MRLHDLFSPIFLIFIGFVFNVLVFALCQFELWLLHCFCQFLQWVIAVKWLWKECEMKIIIIVDILIIAIDWAGGYCYYYTTILFHRVSRFFHVICLVGLISFFVMFCCFFDCRSFFFAFLRIAQVVCCAAGNFKTRNTNNCISIIIICGVL